jgi:uncharacterized membrane protein
MKQLRNIFIGLVAASALTLAGCGGGGGGGGGVPASGPDPTPVTNSTFNSVALGGLGGSFSAGIAINDSGLAVGFADDGNSIKAAQWTVSGAAPAATALAPLSGNNYSAAYGVNNTGITVGESGAIVASVADASTVAVFWSGGTVTQLPAPAGNLGAYAAYSINNNGQIVGESVKDASGNTKAVLWDSPASTSTMNDNLHQAGWDYSAAYFIHDDGVIVGEAKPAGGAPQGVIWTPAAAGAYTFTLLPPLTGGAASVAFGLDDQGRVVGESEASNGVVNGVVWTVNTLGTAITATDDLGANTSAQAINGADRIVGYTGPGTGSDSGTIWNGAKFTDNKALAPAFSQAFGINASNQVVGISGSQGFAATPQ